MTDFYANDNSDKTPKPKPARVKAYHAYIAVVVLAIAFTATYRTMTAQTAVDGNWVISACLTPNGMHHSRCHDYIVGVTRAVTLIGYEGRKACPPGDISPDKMHDDIAVNLSYNPDMLRRSAEDLIAAAAIKAYPCRLNLDSTRTIE